MISDRNKSYYVGDNRRTNERTPRDEQIWNLIVEGMLDAGNVYREHLSHRDLSAALRKIAAEMCRKIGELEK
ncbi:MAG: hypothetical protein U1E51_06580 [Candidatus Binatia bacterium]|nr:hypothetical protein [Candidatus Binatia bacterium]